MDTKYFRSMISAVLVVGLTSGLAHGQLETVSLSLSIAPSPEGLPIAINLNTLAPELGIRTDHSQSLQIDGSIDVELDYLSVEGDLVPQGLRIVGGSVTQNDLGANYEIEAGKITFTTNAIAGHFETLDETSELLTTVLVDERGVFDASGVTLKNTSGSAQVGVPLKPVLVGQSLGGNEVASSRLISPDAPTGQLDFEMIGSNDQVRTYAVDLSFEMIGRQLTYDGVGLPTWINFESGSIAAVGTFSIPEPSTAALLMLAAAATASRRRRCAVPRG